MINQLIFTKRERSIVPLLIMSMAFLLFNWHPSYGQTTVTYTSDSSMTDAMVANGGVETMNFGSQKEIHVFHQIGQQIPMVFRTFIQYDLSAIPEGAMITEAKLKLDAKSVNNTISHPIYIERVENTSWSEGSITWNNQPGVISSDQLSFSHSHTSGTGSQEFDVTDHVQHMVNNPGLNNGWRIRLQSEQNTSDYGIVYHSSESDSTTRRPKLELTYIMPIEMTTTVSHCTAGNNDGTLSVAVSGGSTYSISNMFFYKTNRDLAHRGKATLSNYKTTGNLQYNSGTGTVTAENLEPGIYILRILDAEYYTNSDLRFAFYKHILVGRDGEITSGILFPNYQYQENTSIEYDKPTNTNPLDRANTNYHSNSSVIPLRVADAPNNYEKASLIKYEIDFDDQLEFSKAELQIKAWSKFFRHNNSSNATTYSRVTSDWEESQVTWNTRPTIDSLMTVTVPTTTVIGYDPVHLYDTIPILSFVEHWQENPTENYGFEIALETYGATQLALRDYKSTLTNSNYIQFDFSPIQDVVTTFDDTTNTGTLTVNAPGGTLPYTYLINTDSLGSLTDIWNEIGDSTLVDSLDFFTGDISSTQFTFTDLPSGRYFIAVYDNSGTKILDGSGIVNTEIQLYNDTDLDLSASNVITRSSGAQGDGAGRLHAELLADDSWGGVSFTPETIGEFYIGFNKTSDGVATIETDLEFGIKIGASGAYQIIENNVLLSSGGTVTAGEEISLFRDYNDYVLLIGGSEIYRDEISNLVNEDISTDVVLTNATVAVLVDAYWERFSRPRPSVEVTYPECGNFNGAINIYAGYGKTITSCTIENNDAEGTVPVGALAGDGSNCSFPFVPIGTYTLTVEFTPVLFGESYTIVEQIAIGYVVDWDNMVNNYVSPLNTIRKGPGPIIPLGWSTANSTNRTIDGYKNWIQFETDVNNYFLTSMNREKLMLRNQSGEIIYELETAQVPGASMAFQGPDDLGLVGVSLLAGPNGVWRIEQDEELYSLFKNNESIASVMANSDNAEPVYEIAIEQNGSAQYIKTIASFCNNYPIGDQYIEPKREIEGGYFVVPNDDTLRFEFNEEYTLDDNEGNLKYTVRNFAGVSQNDVLDDLEEIYGDNRFLLDVSSLSNGVYIMEIINDKGENWFLRFKK